MDFAGELPVAGRKVHYFQTTTRKAAPSLVDPRPPLSQTKYENNCPIVRAFAPMRNAENSGHSHCQFVAMLSQMRRGIHITVALALALLLLRPFDCFAAMSTPKAMACCVKGKCLPTTDADECCKGALTSDQVAAVKASHVPVVPSLDFAAVTVLPVTVPQIIDRSLASYWRSAAPPGSPPDVNRNLPLLI